MREDLLKKALEEAIDEDMSFIPNRQELEEMHEFSEIFDKKIRKMAKQKKKFRFRYYKTLSAVAACLAVVILAGVFSQTLLSPDKRSDTANSEYITAEQTDDTEELTDTADPMEDNSVSGFSSESAIKNEDEKDSITDRNGIVQDDASEENLMMGSSSKQRVEKTFVEEQLKQCQEVVCKNYQIEGTTCSIWLDQKSIQAELNTAECTIYLCTENGEWYQYTALYTEQTEDKEESRLDIADFPEEAYTSLYVMVDGVAIILEEK